jgi:hypothetical protein
MTMGSDHNLSRLSAWARIAGPGLLLVYAVCRWFDGLDGSHGPGWAWNLGHLTFLVSFVCFEIVLLSLNLSIARRGGTMRIVAVVAGVLGTVGVGLFLWVIVGDLLPSFVDAFDLPDPVMAAGPLLFLLGLMSPLVVLSWSRPRRLPAFAPVAVVLAFILIVANLDLLVLGALLFGWGLWSIPEALDEPSVAVSA